MNAPEGAIILSVDEKTQIQTLDHTQPLREHRRRFIVEFNHSLFGACVRRAGQPGGVPIGAQGIVNLIAAVGAA